MPLPKVRVLCKVTTHLEASPSTYASPGDLYCWLGGICGRKMALECQREAVFVGPLTMYRISPVV